VREFTCSSCGERSTDLYSFTIPDEWICSACAPDRPKPEPDLPALGYPFVDIEDVEVEPEVVALINRETAERLQAIPINRTGTRLVVAMAAPSDEIVEQLEAITDHIVEPVMASPEQIAAACDKYYAG
jgi:hypothetical protein